MAKTATPTKRASRKSTLSEPAVTPSISTPATVTTLSAPPRKTIRSAPKAMPTSDQIAARAYEIWLAKGCPGGQDLENWRQAEAELLEGCELTTAA